MYRYLNPPLTYFVVNSSNFRGWVSDKKVGHDAHILKSGKVFRRREGSLLYRSIKAEMRYIVRLFLHLFPDGVKVEYADKGLLNATQSDFFSFATLSWSWDQCPSVIIVVG